MLTCLFLYFVILHMVNKSHRRRYDGSAALPYWGASDLGIEERPFAFTSGQWVLRGSKYFNKSAKPRALVVFFHGIGDGRASYIKEISALVKEGYLVYAYDNTGCMESEGPYIYSLGQTQKDQKAFFNWLDEDSESRNLKRFVIGHSWGGYGALMATNPAFKVEKCVSLAGFARLSDVYISFIKPKFLHKFWFLMHLVLINQSGFKADESVIKVLKKTNSKVLYIQGDADDMVLPEVGYEALQKEFGISGKIKFLIIPHRRHYIFKSQAAEEYVSKILKEGITSPLGPVGLSLDLAKATELDPKTWKAIFDFLGE